MISASTSEFIFIQIAAGRPALAWYISSRMWSRMRARMPCGDDRHGLELGRLGIAGDEVEDARHVVADGAVGGEEGQVGVDLGGDRMIVAGADVAVGDELAALAPHDQAELGVGLELDEAIHHLHAGAFQIARPVDVGLLVEAGLELDHGGDRLAGFGRVLQRLDDRRCLAGAVERPLDGHHVGVGGACFRNCTTTSKDS